MSKEVWQSFLSIIGLIALFSILALILSGCTSSYTGSRTIVGEQMALPEISDSSDSVAVRVYESVKGAKVWTAKNAIVRIEYSNAYTNSYFGVVESQDTMRLKVEIEPTEAEEAQAGDE